MIPTTSTCSVAHPLEGLKLELGLLTHMCDLFLELGAWLRLGREPTFLHGRQRIVLPESALLTSAAALLFRRRTQGGQVQPEYAGKLNFYLSAVDGELHTERDEWTIGFLLCDSHESAIIEYSFKDIAAPVRDELPSVQDHQGVVAKLKAEVDCYTRSVANTSEAACVLVAASGRRASLSAGTLVF